MKAEKTAYNTRKKYCAIFFRYVKNCVISNTSVIVGKIVLNKSKVGCFVKYLMIKLFAEGTEIGTRTCR